MPVQINRDSTSCYARWGNQGKKYYYKCGSDISRANAKRKSLAQGIAIGDFPKTRASSLMEQLKEIIKKGKLC
jgi:hypothetical protein